MTVQKQKTTSYLDFPPLVFNLRNQVTQSSRFLSGFSERNENVTKETLRQKVIIMMKLRQSFSVAVSYVLSVCNTVALSLLIHFNHCPQAPWTNTAKTAPTLPLCLVLFRELIQQSRARAVFLAQANFLSFLFCLLLCLHFDMPTETRHI